MFSFNVFKKPRFLAFLTKRSFAISQFSFKNKMNLFLKHVHPDILGGDCPKQLKVENEKAIQEFKQYIDNVEKNYPNSARKLTFNITIENKLVKQKVVYKKIEIDLEETQPSNENNMITAHQLNIQFAIDKSISTINMLKDNKVKQEDVKESSFEEDNIQVKTKLEKKPRIMKSKKMMDDINNFALNRFYYSLIERAPYTFSKRKLMKTLDRMLYPRYPFKNMRKTDSKVRNMVKNLDSYEELDLLQKISFPPQLVFIDENLKKNQFQTAIENLKLKSSMKRGEDNIVLINELKEIVNIMVEPNSLLRLYVSDEYSITKMPGFITIPYNFNLKSFKEFFMKNREEALKVKKDYIEECRIENDIKKELLLTFSFNSIEIVENDKRKISKGALELKKETCLYLKQFKKYLNTKLKNCNLSKFKVFFGAEETKEVKSGNLTELYIKIPVEDYLLDRILKNMEKIMI